MHIGFWSEGLKEQYKLEYVGVDRITDRKEIGLGMERIHPTQYIRQFWDSVENVVNLRVQ
jgi:hypothetical protein